ncbi:MAG: hypothetical protein GJU76_06025 [Gallionella sp.]|jgi:hypothetical protein|nr:hypothetical protein [Gallionella sp.]
MTPDLARDNELLEDAAYYIYLSRRKDPDFGPVTLHWNNIPPRNGARPAVADTRTFSSNEAALKQACKLMGSRGFHEPFIATKAGELIFDKLDLRQECETRAKAPNALEAVAQSIRKNKALFSTRGPTMLTPIERANHERLIESLADRLDALADKARQGRADYRQFDDVLRELHAANFFPDRDLVSTAARALVYAT